MKTIINWQTVNTRKKDKNLPRKLSTVVCRPLVNKSQKESFPKVKEDIFTSRVYEENGLMFVMNNLVKYSFSDGFMWAYLDDIEDIE